MPSQLPAEQFFVEDMLAGLAFLADDQWCYFRVNAFEFNYRLDRSLPYAVIDPESGNCIGILRPSRFLGVVEPRAFQVFLLKPLHETLVNDADA
jgi:hypothetical protein